MYNFVLAGQAFRQTTYLFSLKCLIFKSIICLRCALLSNNRKMAIYSIRDLEKLTGIKAHTIRIWEQRYRLISPARTETNIRYYTDENLRLLFNIALLNRYGHKISHLAKMEPEEIAVRVSEISRNNTSHNAQIDALTLAMIDLNEATFDRIFATHSHELGFDRTMRALLYHFLYKLRN